jgi:D-beta-D-heptose 7-phosphate kinase/D-beta-D-heptose 1-phosphate adenosyltransferase
MDKTLKLLTESNSTPKIAVLGDIILDHYREGRVNRLSPEAPVPVVLETSEKFVLGGAGNVAKNLVSLGANVDIFGICGSDADYSIICNILDDSSIGNSLLALKTERTICKERITVNSQQLLRIDSERRFSVPSANKLVDSLFDRLGDYDAVIISDYDKGSVNCLKKLIALCREKKILTVVDPKGSDFSKYHGASIITPNLSEFKAIVGEVGSHEDFVERALSLRQRLNLDYLVVTRGREGLSFVGRDDVFLSYKATQSEVFDVTGAGDSVIAALTFFFHQTSDFKISSFLANIAGGLAVKKIGSYAVSAAEIMHAAEFVDMYSDESSGKTVFTNGCFDILHPGHLDYLKRARELGDYLIVGLNSDSSVSVIKGKNRPVNNISHRKLMLQLLPFVDEVVVFNEETPLELIKQLRPNVLVKGGDYNFDTVVGAQLVVDMGGEVKILSFLEGFSTSSIIKNARALSD